MAVRTAMDVMAGQLNYFIIKLLIVSRTMPVIP